MPPGCEDRPNDTAAIVVTRFLGENALRNVPGTLPHWAEFSGPILGFLKAENRIHPWGETKKRRKP